MSASANCVLWSTALISPDGVYRYRLRRQWDYSGTLCCWVMLNPSTADASTDDPTIRRCIAFSRGWGYGGIVVVNLYGLRSMNPRQLRVHHDPVGPDNDAHIAELVRESEMVMCAWGAHPVAQRRDRTGKVIKLIRRCKACPEVRCLGLTQDGAPRHPLYVRSDVSSMPFPVGA